MQTKNYKMLMEEINENLNNCSDMIHHVHGLEDRVKIPVFSKLIYK